MRMERGGEIDAQSSDVRRGLSLTFDCRVRFAGTGPGMSKQASLIPVGGESEQLQLSGYENQLTSDGS